MTPAERKRAEQLAANASPGPWTFADESTAGPSSFTIRASGAPILKNIEIDWNGLNNLAFVTEARTLLPKALMHIATLEGDIENLKAGFGKTSPAIMTLEEITRAKDIGAAATKGEWSWEDDSRIGRGVATLYADRGPMAHGLNLFGRFTGGQNMNNDLAFITEARQLLPKAMEHLEDLSTEMQRLTRPALTLKPAPAVKPPAPKPPGHRDDDDRVK